MIPSSLQPSPSPSHLRPSVPHPSLPPILFSLFLSHPFVTPSIFLIFFMFLLLHYPNLSPSTRISSPSSSYLYLPFLPVSLLPLIIKGSLPPLLFIHVPCSPSLSSTHIPSCSSLPFTLPLPLLRIPQCSSPSLLHRSLPSPTPPHLPPTTSISSSSIPSFSNHHHGTPI